MPKIEFIFDRDCPNVEAAKEQLERALANLGLKREWHEWDRADPNSPAYAKGYGSPTILVDGKDVAGAEPSNHTQSCRVYQAEDGQLQGVPTIAMIESALKKSDGASARSSCCG